MLEEKAAPSSGTMSSSIRTPRGLASLALVALGALGGACGLQVQGDAPALGKDGGTGGGGTHPTQGGDDAAATTGDDASGGGTGDGASGGGDGSTLGNTTVVYPMTTSTLYSFDVVSHALNKVGAYSGCAGGQLRDIAIDALGGIWGISSSGLYIVSATGPCVTAKPLDAANETHGISFPPAGQPGIFALHDAKKDLFRIDTSTGSQATVKGDLLPDDAGPDLVCSTSQCWAILDSGKEGCTGGSTDCIFSFDANGENGAPLGSIAGSHKDVNGLAYARGKLYAFCGNGDILEIPPQSPGQAVPLTPTLGAGIPSVPGWQGAGSTSAAP